MDVIVHKFTDSHKIFCSLTGKVMAFSSYGDVQDANAVQTRET